MEMNVSDVYKDLKPPAVVRHMEPSELERIVQDKSAADTILRNFYSSIIKELVHSLMGTKSFGFSDEKGRIIEAYKDTSGKLVAGITYGDSGNIDDVIYYRKSGAIVILLRKDVFPADGILLKPDYVESILPDHNQIYDGGLKKAIEKYIQKQRKKEEGIKIRV